MEIMEKGDKKTAESAVYSASGVTSPMAINGGENDARFSSSSLFLEFQRGDEEENLARSTHIAGPFTSFLSASQIYKKPSITAISWSFF